MVESIGTGYSFAASAGIGKRNWRKARQLMVGKTMAQFNKIAGISHYLNEDEKPSELYDDFTRLTLAEQEGLFVRDLLYLFLGHNGANIRHSWKKNEIVWSINESADPCLRASIQQCLPLAGDFIKLDRNLKTILSDPTRGNVALAVASFVDEYIQQDYSAGILQLESDANGKTKKVDVMTMALSTRQSAAAIGRMNAVIGEIISKDLIGGEIISTLRNRLSHTVTQIEREVLKRMLNSAESQYYRHVVTWIRHGTVAQDLAHEFFIWDSQRSKINARPFLIPKEDDISEITTSPRAENEIEEDMSEWLGTRYFVVPELCPSTLAPAMVDIIKCGRYLHIIRQKTHGSQWTPEVKNFDTLKSSSNGSNESIPVETFIAEIRQVRDSASRHLIHIMTNQEQLDQVFDAVSQFMLVGNSQWLCSFIDSAEEVLMKPNAEIHSNKLALFFDLAIENSSLKDSKFVDLFKPTMQSVTMFQLLKLIASTGGSFDANMTTVAFDGNEALKSQHLLTGFDLFSIEMQCTESPLNLIFDRRALIQYSIIFRLLFALHRACKLLSRKWLNLSIQKGILPREQLMRDQMTHFVDVYLAHCTGEVIEAEWNTFRSTTKKASSIEAMVEAQTAFLDATSKHCLLKETKFVGLLDTILTIISNYANGKKYGDSSDFPAAFEKSIDGLQKLMNEIGRQEMFSANLALRLFPRT